MPDNFNSDRVNDIIDIDRDHLRCGAGEPANNPPTTRPELAFQKSQRLPHLYLRRDLREWHTRTPSSPALSGGLAQVFNMPKDLSRIGSICLPQRPDERGERAA
jgi:hypothetical protein